ncbi:MAG: ATP-binding protein [Candidatus Edwardsbacteria bacterium]|nr:ATP-binding protein [Candidatus Edwardsbacteria bacterium]
MIRQLNNIWSDFVSSGLGEEIDRTYLRRVKFANALSFLGVLTLLGFGTARMISGDYPIGLADLAVGIFMVLNLIFLRLSKKVMLASSLGVGCLLVLILFLYVSGGVNRTGIYWIYFFPVVSFFLYGMKGGLIWMAILYISILGLQVAAHAGGIPVAYDVGTSTHMLASLMLESALVCYYAKVMENEEKVVVAHNMKLRETSQIIQNEMSQRKKAEDELLRISQAVRSSSDAIAIEDVDGTHLYHNKSFYNLFKYSISGLNAYGGFAKLFIDPSLGRSILEVVRTGGSWTGEVEVKKKDNGTVQTYLRINAINDHSGKTIGSVFIYTDVSERKKWENALVASEERFRKVVASISDHIYMTSYSAEGKPINDYISPNVEKLTGHPYSRFLEDWGFWANDLIHPEDRAAARVQVENFKKGWDSQVEYRIIRSDGKTIWIRDSGRVEKQNGNITVYGVVSDISANKYQEEIKETLLEELQKANRELAEFAYIVSHDLKAPLRAISSLAQWLSEDYRDILDEAGKEKVGLLLGRTKRMHNLIEGVLAYSRLGRMKPTMCRIDSHEETRQIIDLLSPPGHIKITIDGKLPTIIYDRIHFDQIMQNLLSNAIKYNDKECGLITISCRQYQGYWEYLVSDNGLGIEEQHFDRIFKIFQSLKSRDEFESTGIGLTIVKKIVEYHGGSIKLTSQLGRGSEFRFTIPGNLQPEPGECGK